MNRYNLEEEKIRQMQPLVLAMIGDSVQTLFVREYVAVNYGVKVNKMNKIVTSVVKAGAQYETYKKIEEFLLDNEKDIARRARNSNIHTKSKNFSYMEYIHATALEAVIGYLYMCGNKERLDLILNKSLEELVVEN